MSGEFDEDDKPTVILDLNALKKQKLKQEEDIANLGKEIEFSISMKTRTKIKLSSILDSKGVQENDFYSQQPDEAINYFRVILFDFESDFFRESIDLFPAGYDYQMANDLAQLNKYLASKEFQLIVFNYDVGVKAVNQLIAQIKKKFPFCRTLIVAKKINREKAAIHSKTPSGASGYYQLPLEQEKLDVKFQKIYQRAQRPS